LAVQSVFKQQPVQAVSFFDRHFVLSKSKTVPFGHVCMIGPNVVHRKNMLQLNGEGVMEPSSHVPVGHGAKSQVADDIVIVETFAGVGG